jgi:hypothetical protein
VDLVSTLNEDNMLHVLKNEAYRGVESGRKSSRYSSQRKNKTRRSSASKQNLGDASKKKDTRKPMFFHLLFLTLSIQGVANE